MSTITTRSGKGSPLTSDEVDSNFTNLNTDKLELSGGTMTGSVTFNGTVLDYSATASGLFDSITETGFAVYTNNRGYVVGGSGGNTGYVVQEPKYISNLSVNSSGISFRIHGTAVQQGSNLIWTTSSLIGYADVRFNWSGSAISVTNGPHTGTVASNISGTVYNISLSNDAAALDAAIISAAATAGVSSNLYDWIPDEVTITESSDVFRARLAGSTTDLDTHSFNQISPQVANEYVYNHRVLAGRFLILSYYPNHNASDFNNTTASANPSSGMMVGRFTRTVQTAASSFGLTSNSNGNINLDPNGSGKVIFKGNSTKGSGQFVLNCENNSHGITVKGPPHSAGASYTLTLPDDDGNSGEALTSDGSGNLSWSTVASGSTSTVTVSGGKFYIDGTQQATLSLEPGSTYKFDQSDSSNSSHPLRFSTTSDGTHNSGSEYTTGVTTNGTAGSAGAYTEIAVTYATPSLYYYCTNHSGMGAGSVVGNSSGYTHPNHSGEVTSTGDGATVISDNVVDEANLKVSNTPTDGYVLTARSGNTGGMTWEAASGGIALTDLSVTQNSASGSGTLSYDNTSGVFSYTPPASSGGGGSTASALTEQEFTATAGQTVFTVTGGITNADNVVVFLNGSRLADNDINAISTSAGTVTLNAAATVGDIVTVSEFGAAFGSQYSSTIFTVGTSSEYNTTSKVLTTDYTANRVAVYLNGVKLLVGSSNDFTATDGSSIDLTNAAPVTGDKIEVVEHGTLAEGVTTGKAIAMAIVFGG